MTGREAWSFFAGFIVGVVAILALVSLPLAMERDKWKNVAEEQAGAISRYEAITAGYEELTAELFEMLEGGGK
jgi:hypothetical protein